MDAKRAIVRPVLVHLLHSDEAERAAHQKRLTPNWMLSTSTHAGAAPTAIAATKKGLRPVASLQLPTNGLCVTSSRALRHTRHSSASMGHTPLGSPLPSGKAPRCAAECFVR